jgi:sporulation protein YlmC with PRC-barrel domain
MIRTSDLAGKRVRRENGDRLGRVYEIRLRDSQVAALICGSRGLFQRLTGSVLGHRIEWKHVLRVTPSEIVIADTPGRKLRRKKNRARPRTKV